ncbi:hypothetical protein EJ262_23995 [Salmonella enterica]|nr:hypothetical protein [Salmonella enterica]
MSATVFRVPEKVPERSAWDWVAAVREAAMVPGLLQKQQVLLKHMVICPPEFLSSLWAVVVVTAVSVLPRHCPDPELAQGRFPSVLEAMVQAEARGGRLFSQLETVY